MYFRNNMYTKSQSTHTVNSTYILTYHPRPGWYVYMEIENVILTFVDIPAKYRHAAASYANIDNKNKSSDKSLMTFLWVSQTVPNRSRNLMTIPKYWHLLLEYTTKFAASTTRGHSQSQTMWTTLGFFTPSSPHCGQTWTFSIPP